MPSRQLVTLREGLEQLGKAHLGERWQSLHSLGFHLQRYYGLRPLARLPRKNANLYDLDTLDRAVREYIEGLAERPYRVISSTALKLRLARDLQDRIGRFCRRSQRSGAEVGRLFACRFSLLPDTGERYVQRLRRLASGEKSEPFSEHSYDRWDTFLSDWGY